MDLTPQQIEMIEAEVTRQSPQVQDRYRAMVAHGESPRFAIMAAMQKAPETRYTDKTFNAKRRQVMESGMKPKMRDAYLKMAKQAGISTQGKYYVGGLGRPTDPMAWVSTVDDAKQVCKLKNYSAEGLLHHEGHSVEPAASVAIADDIRDSFVEKRLAADPGLAAACAKDPAKLRQVQGEVVDRHAKPRKRGGQR